MKIGHSSGKERGGMCLLDEVSGVQGDDWAAMMRVLLQVSLGAAHVQANNFAILTIE